MALYSNSSGEKQMSTKCAGNIRRNAFWVALTIAASAPWGPHPCHAQNAAAASSQSLSIDAYVAQAAQRFGIAEHWIWSVMRVESGGRRLATSPAGAMGLMQIMPATWGALRAKHGLGNDPYDAHDNIMAGAAYLREMHDRYGPNGMLAVYNAGPGRYEEYLTRGRPLPEETLSYVAKLVPMIGGTDVGQITTPPSPRPLHWTQAALFAVQSSSQDTGAKTSVHDTVKALIDTPNTASSTPETTPLKASPTGLFVPLSGAHRP